MKRVIPWLLIPVALGIVLAIAYLPLSIPHHLDFLAIYHADLGVLRRIPIYDLTGQVDMIADLAIGAAANRYRRTCLVWDQFAAPDGVRLVGHRWLAYATQGDFFLTGDSISTRIGGALCGTICVPGLIGGRDIGLCPAARKKLAGSDWIILADI